MSDTYELYYFPGTASAIPHMILEETGAPFKLHLLDRMNDEHKSSAYLKLNPAGRIPVLVQGDMVLTETAAICLHIIDQNPGCGLAPALGTAERANLYKWLMFLTNTVQVEMLTYHYTGRHTTDEVGVPGIKAKAEQRLGEWFDIIEKELAANGPFLLGDQISLVDHYLCVVSRWGRSMNNPTNKLPHVAKLRELVMERPAVQRALASEGFSPVDF